MKVLGLITEYNPFHNGHLYHLEEAKKVTNADYTLCVMSGNFVQRGEPAIINKWARAQSAIEAGVDLVIELPVVYSCQTAELFALGSVKMLNSLNIVDYLVFGSESGDIKSLSLISDALIEENPILQSKLKEGLNKGLSFFIAREYALQYFFSINNGFSSEEISNIISKSNNILGVEYLKALSLTKSSITPLTIKRIKSDYNSKVLIGNIGSATAIREKIKVEGIGDFLYNFMPKESVDILQKEALEGRGPVFIEYFTDIILYLLKSQGRELLAKIMDVNEGLDNRIIKSAKVSTDIDSLVTLIKSKRYPRTRLQRILCHCLLDLSAKEILRFRDDSTPEAIRILGFSQRGRELIKFMSKKTNLPIITRVAPYLKRNNSNTSQLKIDIKATDIYALAYKNNKYRISGLDFINKPFSIDH